MLGPRGARRIGAAVMTMAAMTMLTACGPGDDPVPDATPAVTDPTTTTPPQDAEAEAVEAQWQKYWEIRIASENAGEFDRAEFDGIATGPTVESHVNRINDYRENKLVRVGRPSFRDPEVTVDGAGATLTACYNSDDWTAKVDGEPFEAEDKGWEPIGNRFERQGDGTWIIVANLSVDELATLGASC